MTGHQDEAKVEDLGDRWSAHCCFVIQFLGAVGPQIKSQQEGDLRLKFIPLTHTLLPVSSQSPKYNSTQILNDLFPY